MSRVDARFVGLLSYSLVFRCFGSLGSARELPFPFNDKAADIR